MSGVVPQVAAILGPCAAGTAYIPALAAFVPMVRGTASMALGGPHLVKAAIGEEIRAEELGGSQVHCYISGCADLEVPDDRACLQAVQAFLSYLPGHNQEPPPVQACSDPVPGFMIGSAVEKQGIIRHGAKMLYAVSEATVPKLTVVLRKAYGAGYFVMCDKGYDPDLIVAWPTAEISVMGHEGAVNIVFRKAIAAAPDPAAMRQQLMAEVRKIIDPYIAAGHAMIDDIIDPAETRKVLIQGPRLAAGKRAERPWRKHGVMPV